jgi:hypothetical protein
MSAIPLSSSGKFLITFALHSLSRSSSCSGVVFTYMDTEKPHGFLSPLFGIKVGREIALVGRREMQIKIFTDSASWAKQYFGLDVLNRPDLRLAEMVVESPIARMDDAVDVRIVVKSRTWPGMIANQGWFWPFDWPQSECPIFRHSGEGPT